MWVCDGKLIGVPTAGASVPNPSGQPSAGNIGLGFAIPVDLAKSVSDQLIATGSVTHSSFGVRPKKTSTSHRKKGARPAPAKASWNGARAPCRAKATAKTPSASC